MKLELLPVNAKKQQINPASCHLADKFPHFNPKPKRVQYNRRSIMWVISAIAV